jgi:hypothetical protein
MNPQVRTWRSAAATRGSLGTIAALSMAAGSIAAADPPDLDEVMRRAHEYVAVYEDHELSTVIARERYHQQLLDSDGRIKTERTLLSDYLLLQMPPEEDWFALRDVYDVDGEPVGDRAARLERLLTGPREKVSERAMEIAEESARFNVGEVPRTINVPTLPLRFLRPANRKHFDFSKVGEAQMEGGRAWIIAYRETRNPTFSATIDGRDVPARGRYWIDPQSGAIIRSEMVLGGTRQLPTRATVTVTYRLEPSLGFRVPIEMRERYDNPRRKTDDVIVAVATYSDFRPFDQESLKPVHDAVHDTQPVPSSVRANVATPASKQTTRRSPATAACTIFSGLE